MASKEEVQEELLKKRLKKINIEIDNLKKGEYNK